MRGSSIRARLTAWYVAALTIATLSVAGGSWWLSTQSVIHAADTGLEARIEGVRAFLENPHTIMTVESLRDEFEEYAELTRGEALLEVVDTAGVVLCRPAFPGWADLAGPEGAVDRPTVPPTDRMSGQLPFRVASASLNANGRTYRVTVAAPMGPAYAALNRFHRLLLVLLPVVIAVAGAGGYWISRRALAPVDEITRAVQAITVQSLDQRLELPRADDELRRLAVTFNHVLERLEGAVADIVRFTADASHELRTPVSIVRTTAELALRHERTPEEYRRALSDVGVHAQHMSELVNDLLVLARTDAGIEPRDTTCLDLREVVEDARTEIDEMASRHAVRLAVRLPSDRILVDGDHVSLRRLLLILLDNAVKDPSSGGEVRLGLDIAKVALDGSSAVIEVADDGIGMDVAETDRVFERFYRGSRARAHAPEGTGLGLAIAHTIVERYRGTIAVTPSSTNGHGGCTVTVRLPIGVEDRSSDGPHSRA